MAEKQYATSAEKIRWFNEFHYAAKSWKQTRRIIVKIEHTEKGNNPRYVVTNLTGKPQLLYDDLYCQRGEMENRIKEQQRDLFADRTSCHRWWSNQFRLLLSSLAYILLETIRRLALQGTELTHAYVSTLRLKLIKVGAAVLRNTRRIHFGFANVSILARLWGRALLSATALPFAHTKFQSSPGFGAGRYGELWLTSGKHFEFQSSPGFGAGRYRHNVVFATALSVFQSSPGFGAGRYHWLTNYARRVGLFQSSPGFGAGRYVLELPLSVSPE